MKYTCDRGTRIIVVALHRKKFNQEHRDLYYAAVALAAAALGLRGQTLWGMWVFRGKAIKSRRRRRDRRFMRSKSEHLRPTTCSSTFPSSPFLFLSPSWSAADAGARRRAQYIRTNISVALAGTYG